MEKEELKESMGAAVEGRACFKWFKAEEHQPQPGKAYIVALWSRKANEWERSADFGFQKAWYLDVSGSHYWSSSPLEFKPLDYTVTYYAELPPLPVSEELPPLPVSEELHDYQVTMLRTGYQLHDFEVRAPSIEKALADAHELASAADWTTFLEPSINYQVDDMCLVDEEGEPVEMIDPTLWEDDE